MKPNISYKRRSSVFLAGLYGLLLIVGALLLLTSPAAKAQPAPIDVDISAYYDTGFPWADETAYSPYYLNGPEIAAAPTDGNTGTGITFGDYDGNRVIVGYEGSSSPAMIDFSPVTLPEGPGVNALLNSLYGVSGEVDGTFVFENSGGATASFSLVGNQTIRDFNNNVYTNDLQGYDTDPAAGTVTTQNWWNNKKTGGHQRLDVATFVLPSSWAGTQLVSLTITNPYASQSATADVVLSALQVVGVAPLPVVSVTAAVPEVTVGSGLSGKFTLTIQNALRKDLNVVYALKGTAVDGTDYQMLTGAEIIKAGKTKANIEVVPIGDLGGASKKTVKLVLESKKKSYTVGTTKPAKVKILAAP